MKLPTSREDFVFRPSDDRWKLSLDNTVNLTWVRRLLSEPVRSSARKTLEFYARTFSPAHARNMCERLKDFAETSSQLIPRIRRITEDLILNYRATLSEDHEWKLGALRGFLLKWHSQGHPGIDPAAIEQLRKMTLKSNPKGEAVLLRDPYEGALSDLEFDGLLNKLTIAFEANKVSLEDFALVLLFMATGRRPRQVGDIRCSDLVEATSSQGLSEYVLKIPRRKQKGSGWRSSFRPYALSIENGLLMKKVIDSNRRRLKEICGCIPDKIAIGLPLFPNWEEIIEHRSTFRKFVHTQLFHCEAFDLRRRLIEVVDSLGLISERTEKPLHVNPLRCRRTTGTRAAREGYGVYVIAELLDHSDTQNAQVYTENVPERVDAINQAIGTQMAPIIQAFAGVLVDNETLAVRGDDPKSRIRNASEDPVGNCGKSGFCGGVAPIACYTCQYFNAWLDGRHREMLEFVVNRQFHILKTTGDEALAHSCDLTIWAIKQVIQLCEQRREELRRGSEEYG